MLTRPEAETQVQPLLAWAERAEQLGFDAIFIGDRMLSRARSAGPVVYNGSGLDPLVTLSAIAARTSRLGIGTLIYQAINARQIVELQSYIAIIAIGYVLINFTIDALYVVLDPRIRRAHA